LLIVLQALQRMVSDLTAAEPADVDMVHHKNRRSVLVLELTPFLSS
jgi:hypothetical protein